MKYFIFLSLSFALFFLACEAVEEISPDSYTCELGFPNDGLNHPLADQLQAILDNYVQHQPGVSLAIRSTTGANWAGTAGYADIPSAVSLQACHRTMVGSISKVFTAATVLRLADEGLINLDAPLNEYLSGEFMAEVDNAQEATVRQLINHSSGIVDYIQDDISFHFERLNIANLRLTASEKLAFVYGNRAHFSPGERHDYSNTNFVLLGLLIEQISGLSLDQAIDQYIFQPLNLISARHGRPADPIPAGTIRPYYSTGGSQFFDSSDFDSGDAATGDGGVAINMQDLTVFALALFTGDLLAPATRQALTDAVLEEGEGEAFGLGVSNYEFFGQNVWGHDGSILGYDAELVFFPELGLSLCVGFNSSSSSSRIENEKDLLFEQVVSLISG